MHRPYSNLTGNARYEGFCIDLLRQIAAMVGFEYRIELVPDGKYGVIDLETGEWNGIVRQLMDKVSENLHTFPTPAVPGLISELNTAVHSCTIDTFITCVRACPAIVNMRVRSLLMVTMGIDIQVMIYI